MSRKGVGLAAFDRSRITSRQFASHGSSLRATNALALETQLSVFRSLLQTFAQTHAKDIRSDPSFRAQFARMCSAIGVDPLASSSNSDQGGSSVWAQLLGKTVNDFYFELAGAARQGLPGTHAGRLVHHRGRRPPRRGDAPAPGGSYAIVTVGRKEYVRSVPRELSNDQASVVEAAQVLGYVSVGMLGDNLGWERARCKTVIEDLVAGGMLWVDTQTGGEWEYWSPGFMFDGDEGGLFDGGDHDDTGFHHY
ncbi:Vacuolar-sorting protein SNF8 [Cladobotryum mycophilum]|uniref:Vacuolar-sorting protein SNF8 n=1 Tax=Cladobotryum mycophilum TaxID=491253 RepID=A0ABR0SS76_9HYPO